jgi:hypothetical protein
VPWCPEAHRHLPRAFREQAFVLLLIWQRLRVLGPAVKVFLPRFWLAELELRCAEGRLFPAGGMVMVRGLVRGEEHNGKIVQVLGCGW